MSDPCTKRDKLGVGYLPTYLELEAERDRYKEALEAIAGKRAPSGAFCQVVARSTLDGEAGKR